jgi:hypothetical protein
MKRGQSHDVPLSRQALELLRQMQSVKAKPRKASDVHGRRAAGQPPVK